MKIKNVNMAGQVMRLRYAGTMVTGDAQGVFEMPDQDGEFLCATPGWSLCVPKSARAIDDAPPAPAKSAPKPTAAVAPKAPEPEPEPEEEGPDLSLMTKAQLIETAAEYKIAIDPKATKAELLELIDSEIYGDQK
jgi:hypothetical protein